MCKVTGERVKSYFCITKIWKSESVLLHFLQCSTVTCTDRGELSFWPGSSDKVRDICRCHEKGL